MSVEKAEESELEGEENNEETLEVKSERRKVGEHGKKCGLDIYSSRK